MILYVKYNENGAILTISDGTFDGAEEIEIQDDSYINDPNSIYNYKIVEHQFVKIEEEEKKQLYPFLCPDEIKIEKAMQEASLQTMITASARTSFLVELPDEQAKDIPYCYTPWGDYVDGYEFTENKERVEYNGGLWKCKKTHKKQATCYPGVDPILWEQLDKENHDGTKLDPIPVPDSVTISGFTYTYGKYYLENGVTYLCKRGGITDEQAEAMYGQSETLYFAPSVLVGTYFKVA